ncbi:MAG: glycosyltransferase family 9 protein [Spirochaetia bacterium]|nr:glycosyltransferase family 9 protein [Spirochaetia bacterium]
MKNIDLNKVKKILIIRHRAIGDIILVTPFIRALRKALPDAEIDMVVEPMGIEVVEGNPYLSGYRVFEKNRLKKAHLFAKIKGTLDFYAGLYRRRYDLVFDLWGNLRTALMALLTGAGYRVGFNFRFRKYLYTHVVVPDGAAKYNAYFHMDLLKPLGIQNDGEKLDFYTGPDDEKAADDFIAGTGVLKGTPVFGLNGAGSWITKRWPEYRFARLADIILEKHPGALIIIIWGPGEREMAERIYSLIKGDKKNVRLSPPTTLKQLAAIIKRMDAFISNDGAPNHIAVAVDTPSVTVFGPTNHLSWVPAGNLRHLEVHSTIACAPCDRMSCPTQIECMNSMEAETVYQRVAQLLKNTGFELPAKQAGFEEESWMK